MLAVLFYEEVNSAFLKNLSCGGDPMTKGHLRTGVVTQNRQGFGWRQSPAAAEHSLRIILLFDCAAGKNQKATQKWHLLRAAGEQNFETDGCSRSNHDDS